MFRLRCVRASLITTDQWCVAQRNPIPTCLFARVSVCAGEARTVTEWVAPNSAAARQAMAATSQAAARAALAALNGGSASAAVAAAGADTAAADEAGASSASAASSAGAASGAGAGGSGGGTITLDALVSNLDKPEAISTLAKTNIDWEQYKVKEGAYRTPPMSEFERVRVAAFYAVV